MAIETAELTKLDRALLEVLRQLEDWVSRPEIGQALGVKLSQYHYERLAKLAEDGLIEMKAEPRGIVSRQWFYRAAS